MHQSISSRNLQFDLLKGIACCAMVIAHSRTIGVVFDTPVSVSLWQMSLFAPVIFFFALGITLWYQVRSRGKTSVVASCLVLGILSLADVGRTNESYLFFGGVNLFGGLALTALIALFLPPQGAIFLSGMFVSVSAERFFSRLGSAPSIISGQLFSIFPWLTYLLFGSIFRFDIKLFRTLSVCLWIATVLYLIQSDYTLTTQDSSTGFILIGLSLCSGLLWICRHVSQSSVLTRFLAWIGRHSLVFYWMHLTILYALPGRYDAFLIWICVLVVTTFLLFFLDKVKTYILPVSGHPLCLLIVALAIPIPELFHFQATQRTIWCTCVLIYFALHLKEASGLVEEGLRRFGERTQDPSDPRSNT